MNNLINLAEDIYRELDEPDFISPAYLLSWMKSNMGKLNLALDTSFEVSYESNDISPELGLAEASILKLMTSSHVLSRQTNKSLNAAASQNLMSISDDGSSVKWADKTSVAASFHEAKTSIDKEMETLVRLYRMNKAKALEYCVSRRG